MIKTLNNYFSKIYCINLDRRPDGWKLCLEEFKQLNIIVERVSAVDDRISGLTQTNINILNDAIKNSYNNILILEDDVQLILNFIKYY